MTAAGIALLAVLALGAMAAKAEAAGVSVGPTMDLGENFHTLGEGVVSPHVPWAKPLPGGPIATLFITPRERSRDAVELIQRVDLDYGSALVYSASQFGHPTDRMVIKGATEADLTERLRTQLARQLEAIVIGSVNWQTIPEEFRQAILQKVAAGTGLLVAYPDPDFDEALKAARAEDFSIPDLFGGLPLEYVQPFREAPDPARAVRDSVQLYHLGRGRVAVVRYGTAKPWAMSCLTPDSPGVVDHEYQMAMLANVLTYVACRHPAGCLFSVSIESKPSALGEEVPEAARLRIATVIPDSFKGKNLMLTVGVQDYGGETVFRQTLSSTPTAGENDWSLPLPPLPAGEYFAHVLITHAGKVLDSGAAHGEVAAPLRVQEVRFDQESYQPGQPVQAEFPLTAPLPEGWRLEAGARDNFGRDVARGEVKLSEDRRSGSVSLPLPPPLTVLHYLRLEVWDQPSGVQKSLLLPSSGVQKSLLLPSSGVQKSLLLPSSGPRFCTAGRGKQKFLASLLGFVL
jgi:hypothetical protein